MSEFTLCLNGKYYIGTKMTLSFERQRFVFEKKNRIFSTVPQIPSIPLRTISLFAIYIYEQIRENKYLALKLEFYFQDEKLNFPKIFR